MFYAVHDGTTGRLISIASVVATPLPGNLVATELGPVRPDLDANEWDTATRGMRPRTRAPGPPPLPDRIVANVKGRATLPARLEAALREALAAEGVK